MEAINIQQSLTKQQHEKMIISFRSVVCVALLLLLGGFKTFGIANRTPNFIFILTDDQPYGYMGCTGNKIVKTPNLDKLASDGILFTNAHVTSAICTPSRASILLSQYERKHGINFNSGTSLSEKGWENAYPTLMRKHGYYTGWIGKNHVPVGNGGYKSGLMERSFDYWYAAHGHLSFYPKDRHEIFKDAKSDTQIEVIQEGINDFLSNEEKLKGVVSFVEQRPSAKPFMLSVCFNLPHGASTSTMQMRDSDADIYKTLYRDIDIPLPANYIAKKDIKTPKLPQEIHHVEDRQDIYDYVNTPTGYRERYIRQIQAMTGIDKLVGEVRRLLKKNDLDKNTVIVFTSDHGLLMGQFGLGGKALCYEYATHVPLIIFDPFMSKNGKGRKKDDLVQTIDIAPSILSMAGIPIPDSYQGQDLTKLISGEFESVRKYLFTENLWSTQFGNPRCEAIQTKSWKYIRYYKNHNFSAQKKIKTAREFNIPLVKILYTVHDPDMAVYRDYVEGSLNGESAVYEELYDLKNDPGEVFNLISDKSYTTVLENMKAAWYSALKTARGKGKPSVLRFTADSESERSTIIKPE